MHLIYKKVFCKSQGMQQKVKLEYLGNMSANFLVFCVRADTSMNL